MIKQPSCQLPKMFRLIVIALTAAAGFESASCANILAIFPHTGKSHFFMFDPLIQSLLDRGHTVTLISHYPLTKPSDSLTFINLKGTTDYVLFNSLDLSSNFSLSHFSPMKAVETIEMLHIFGRESCEGGFNHPQIRDLMRSKKKPSFDLIIVEFFNTDCFTIFSRVFEAPFVGVFSSALMPWHNDRFGSPDNPSYIINNFLPFSSEMNLQQRVINTLVTFVSKIYYNLVFQATADDIIRKHLGDGMPSVSEVVKNASLFLVNSHFSLFQARPLVPGIIEVGGMHVKPGKKLPKHLEDYLNASKNGVIFFSLGSTILGSTIPEKKRKAMAGALGKMPYDVIWKWEMDSMEDKPDNVLLQKWIPQNDLLAHPKVKLFITHSGLMGTQEAVYHGVPLLMIPLFGDQPTNAACCAEKGLGIIVDYEQISEETFLRDLKTVLGNKSYAERAKYVSETFRDRPISILDNAVYWIEYVIKYKGAPHLRSAAVRLPWYSEYLLDVLAVVVVAIFGSAYIAVVIFKGCFCSRKKEKRD